MIRWRIAFAIWLSLLVAASAQQIISDEGVFGSTSVPAGYQGPGDVVSGALVFYSARAYSAAKAGTKAYKIKRASDNTTLDINSLASGLPDTTTPATFCAATTCTIITYYDQTGGNNCGGLTCDLNTNTASGVPTWTSAALGGYPCAFSAASGFDLITTNIFTQSQPFSFAVIANRTANTTVNSRVFVVGGVDAGISYGASGVIRMAAPTNLLGTTTENAFHAYIGVAGTSGAIVTDGSATTGSTGTGGASHQIAAMIDPNGSTGLTGYFCEGGIWPVAMTATQYGNLNSNMHSSTNGWNF